MRMTDLRPGWAIVGNDGHRLGTVRSVGQNYLVATRTGLAGEIYVPASHIANVENEVVYLNLPKGAADEMGWEQPPREEDTPETTPEGDLHRHI
jgi:hypothetical protein